MVRHVLFDADSLLDVLRERCERGDSVPIRALELDAEAVRGLVAVREELEALGAYRFCRRDDYSGLGLSLLRMYIK